VDLLAARQGVRVGRSSRVYETDPVGGPSQPDYLNAVVEVQTTLSPHDLLAACMDVEQHMGRLRTERWGPRIIDIDVLTYGEDEIDHPDLVVPHPRMSERAFVLVPLLELDPDPSLPGEGRITERRLPPKAILGVRPFAPPLEVPG
jgi:2-amino-4-hydroxy-6-hydroxymethyldihydropteridine diphosphokinase